MGDTSGKRKSLQMIQPTVDNFLSGRKISEKRVLSGGSTTGVGKGRKRRASLSVFEDKVLPKACKVELVHKSTNTDSSLISHSNNIENDLCSEEPSDAYWKDLAETRREALEKSLEENEQLHTKVTQLSARVAQLEDEQKDYEELAVKAEQLADTLELLTEGSGSQDETTDQPAAFPKVDA
ncbi:geminin-like isoform X2 [Watersipora subatra]|uniref:geminin-like isoform X2 n=1 Tax=Watersipora subatra TaxID=2589382 RepID=UPI00355B86F1